MGKVIPLPLSAKNKAAIVDRFHPAWERELGKLAAKANIPPILLGISYTQGAKISAGPLITVPEFKQILFHGREQPQISGGYSIGFAGGGFNINLPLQVLIDHLKRYMRTKAFMRFPDEAKTEATRALTDLENRLRIYELRGFDPNKLETVSMTAMIMAHLKTGIVVQIDEVGVDWTCISKEGYSIVNEGQAFEVEGGYATNPNEGYINGIPMRAVIQVDRSRKAEILRDFDAWIAGDPKKAQEKLFWPDPIEFDHMVERGATSLVPAEIAAVRYQYEKLNGKGLWRGRDLNDVKNAIVG